MKLQAIRRGLSSAVEGRGFSLWTWGRGASGSLGQDSDINESIPRRVEGAIAVALASARDVSLACGLFHSCVTIDGHPWLCGRGIGGRLGQGDEEPAHSFQPVASLSHVSRASLGGLHSAFLMQDGRLMTCGFGSFGALGHGNWSAKLEPTHVAALGKEVAAVAAGGAHTLAATRDGALWAFGRDEGEGRLGIESAAQSEGGLHTPARVPSPPIDVAAAVPLAAAGFHSLGIGAAGELLSWGSNANGELGREGGTWAPAPIPSLQGAGVVGVAAGGFHSAAWTADGALYTWGAERNGALGHGRISGQQRVPRRVEGALAGRRVVAAACGSASTFAIDEEGGLWAWGRNSADISTVSADAAAPEAVQLRGLGQRPLRVAAVAAGSGHVVALVHGADS